jgi:hypothetical protein
MRLMKALYCAAALTAFVAPGARADEWNKLTYLTFSGPIQLPGVDNVPAGTYTFRLADAGSSRRVVQVLDKNTGKVFAMFLTMSDHRLTPSEKPVVMFNESPAGSPPAVRAWFYPGETDGYEFVYPKDQAMKIAQQTHQPVLSTADLSPTSGSDSERITSLGSAKIGRVDERGQYSNIGADANGTSADADAVTAAAPPAAPTQTSPAPTVDRQRSASNSSAVGTTGQAGQTTTGDDQATGRQARSGARQLPRTASPLGLVALLSGLSLAGALTVGRLRRRLAAQV